MSEDLFRPQALETRALSLQGDVSLPSGTSTNKLVAAAIVAIVALVAWASTVKYSRIEYALGTLSTNKPSNVIYVHRHGVIEGIAVSSGDLVQKGDTLFVVNVDVLDASRHSVAAAESDSLLAQRELLNVSVASNESLAIVEGARLQESVVKLQYEVGSLQRQLQIQEQISLAAQEVVDRIQPAAELGYVSKIELASRNQAAQQAKQVREQIAQSLNDSRSRLTDTRQQILALRINKDAKNSDVRLQLEGLEQRLTHAYANVTYAVVAPLSGRVTSIQVTEGTRADPTVPALSIIPDRSDYEAVILVPNTAIGELKVGQRVSLMYDAFPFKRYGSFEATIYEIAEHPMSPTQISSSVKQDVPVYRVRAKLKDQVVVGTLGTRPLRQGMTFRASIKLDERTLTSRILEPLKSLTSRM